MKKRVLAFITVLCLLLTLCACVPETPPADGANDELAGAVEAAKEAASVAEKAAAEAREAAAKAEGAAKTEGAPIETAGKIIVLFTNDVHCAVDSGFGYAGLAGIRDTLAKQGASVILADAGDAIQGAPIGTLSEGEYIVDIMNEVGYDVATVGNHEFDYGVDRFMELTKLAKYPYLSCNFTDLSTGKPVLDGYTVLERGGVKIGFVGISTPHTVTSSTPKYFQNDKGEFIYGFCADETGEALYEAVQAAVDAARAEGAEYVVALSHLGISAEDALWTSSDVIVNTTGIDAVIDGHSHSVVEGETVKNKDGKAVLLSQTGTQLQNIGMLTIAPATGALAMQLIEYDGDTASFIDDIQAQYQETLTQVVAKTGVDLEIMDPENDDVRLIRRQETNLGDLCADAYRAISGADIAIVNGGGIRNTIPAGDITYEDIISVHPYGNSLCVVEATGAEILDALELGCAKLPEESGGFLQVSGLSYSVDPTAKCTVKTDENGLFVSVEGERRVFNVMVGDAPIDPAATYTLASHDYLIKNSGDGYTMFTDNELLQDCTMLDNQVLITYIVDSLGGAVGSDYADAYGQGRINVMERVK